MLQFHRYQKSYGDKLIIAADELALDAPFYWLKGGNGSGKTTLLQSIAGIVPFRGDILVNDKTTRRNQITYRLAVNHAAAEPLYPDFLTGHDLITFYTQAKRGSAAQAGDLIDRIGIADFVNYKTGTYSSGMKKKLSLVLAFIGHPELILLDEPLITLDVAAVALLLQLMEEKVAAGIQLLITSHQDMQETFTLAPQPLIIAGRQLKVAL